MPNEADTKGQNEPRIGRGGVGETWGEETIESLKRQLEEAHVEIANLTHDITQALEGLTAEAQALDEAKAELERARLHNIQLLRRKPKHSCIGGP